MNITVEELAPCRKRLRIEVPANRVSEEFDKVADEYTKYVRIPGFRQGKAPRTVVLKKYQKDIEQELQRALVPKAYREACEKRNIHAVTSPNIEDLNYQHGLSMSFSTVVETAPEFTLPNYKGLKLKGASTAATPEEIAEATEKLLSQHAKFTDVTGRALQDNDIAVVKFSGSIGDKPITEIAPEADQLGAAETQWLLIKEGSFIPGFSEQLKGLQIGETRTVNVTFPAEIYIEALKGQSAVYQVELKGIKTRELPEITEELAQQLLQVPAAEFAQKIQDTITEQKSRRQKSELKRQIASQLEGAAQFELPTTLVEAETQDVIQEIVSENQSRGIPVNVLEEKKQEIFDNASRSAKEIVKLNFLLRKIAEAEKIAVTQNELGQYLSYLSMQSQRPIEKLVKQLRDSGGFRQIEQQLLSQKVMDFLLEQANVELA
jgi:trigger factor